MQLKRVLIKCVPRFISDDQKHSVLNACRELKDQLKVNPVLFSKPINGEES